MNRLLLCAVFYGLFFGGCMVEPTFTGPQPINEADRTNFKRKYQGQYWCIKDSSRLLISETNIVQHWEIDFSISKVEVDTTEGLEYRNGKLYLDAPKDTIDAEIQGDSIVGTYQYAKTLFEISDSCLLRKFKGRYFLNTMNAERDWSVKILELSSRHDLSISRIAGVEQISALAELTEVNTTTNDQGDTVEYRLSPTRRELRSILKSSGFNAGTKFRKLPK